MNDRVKDLCLKRRKFNGVYLFLFFLAFTPRAFSQVPHSYRFEQNVRISDKGFTIFSLKNEGLALIHDLNKYVQGKKMWQLEVIDTLLTTNWSTEIALERNLILVGYDYNAKHLFILFREGERDYYNFKLLTVSLDSQEVEKVDIKFEINFRLSHFTMTGNSAVFGGSVNSAPAVLLYDLSINQPKVLPDQFTSNVTLLDLRTNENESFNVLLAQQGVDKKRLVVRTYDHEGTFLVEDIVDIDPKFTILAGLTSTLKRDEMIIAGTYGGVHDKVALGFFSTVIDPDYDQPVIYTKFSSLNHFLDFLPAEKASKIKENAQKENSGSLPEYKAYVAPVRIEENQRGFYLLAEVYNPPGNYNPNTYLYNSYNPINSSYVIATYGLGARTGGNSFRTIPDPYSSSRRPEVSMIQTIVVDFGSNGIPKRDVSLKFNALKQLEPKQVGDFMITKESIFLAYKREDIVFYQRETGEVGKQPSILQSKISLQNQGDVVKKLDENAGDMRFWYDNYFYAWGYQKIKNTSPQINQTRTVFYINRIKVKK